MKLFLFYYFNFIKSLIPCLKTIIDEHSLYGIEYILLGTAHRGRLNILANVFRNPLEEIFCRFNTDIGLSDHVILLIYLFLFSFQVMLNIILDYIINI